jgi:hypothetical protein
MWGASSDVTAEGWGEYRRGTNPGFLKLTLLPEKGLHDPQTGDAPRIFPAEASRRGGPDSWTASTVAWHQMCGPVGLRFL